MKTQDTVMRWAKNALKKTIVIPLFFSFQTTLYSQKLSGEYSISIKTEYDSYSYYHKTLNFKENGEFSYSSTTGHTGSDVIGSGHYKMENKEFVLDFDLTKYNRNGNTTVESKESLEDSITITFKVYYEKKPLPYGNIEYATNKRKHTTVNEKGIAILRIPKSNKEIEFTHSTMGYENQEATLSLNKDHIVEMYVKYSGKGSVKNQKWKYKIKHLGKNVLILEDEKGQKQKWKKNINEKS